MSASTPWLRVILIIGIGAAVALQIGKAPPSLPLLQDDIGISLVTAGWVISVFSLVAALGAAFLGGISDRTGPLRAALGGMVLCASAGIVGAFSTSEAALLVTRTFEGLGFIITSVSAPALITRITAEADRRTALAMWGSYVPIGTGLMLLIAGPLLLFIGWRGVWVVASLLVLVVAGLLWRERAHFEEMPDEAGPRPGLKDVWRVLRTPGPLLLSLTFTFYAAQYLAVAGFLPLILVENHGFRPETASVISAIVIFGNAVGNLTAGFLLRLGPRPVHLVLLGCFVMAVGGALVFYDGSPALVRIAGGLCFATFGGLIPATLFTQVPKQAPSHRQLASVNGMLVQGAAIGQLFGPPIYAALASGYGSWNAAIPALAIAAGIAAAAALVLNHQDRAELT